MNIICILFSTSCVLVTFKHVSPIRLCEDERPYLKFNKIKSCHKSKLPVIGWSNVADLFECMKFARERNGLALNYSPPEAQQLAKKFIRNCEILGCPEIGNMPTLELDELFDYYSAYGNLNSTENATCIKSIGVFSLIEEKLNYSEAIQYCQSIGADLANVLSEVRTNSLAKIIENEISEWYKAAYVGLDDIVTEGVYETPLGTYLTCSSFRAWSPGHPRSKHKNEDCVILDSKKTWRVINCKIKLPFICEFYPEAPLIKTDVLFSGNSSKCDEITEEKKKNKCLENEKELSKIFNESSRLDKCALMIEAKNQDYQD